MKILLSLVFICFSFISFAQNKKLKLKPPSQTPYSKKELAQERKNQICIHKTKMNFSTRLKNYPFNQATQIKFVSFEGYNLPEANDTICYSKLKEQKTLTLLQIDTLTDIIYNVGFGGVILIEEELACYDPRNAILFIDKNGKTFAYIEICFQCKQIRGSSEQLTIGDICDQKFDMLKTAFWKTGITYGVTATQNEN